MPLLQIQDLRTYYYTSTGVRRAIDGVSLSIDKGETLGVVGRSGSGKSVLARSILGLIREPGRIVSGQIVFDGTNLLALTAHELGQLRGKRISLIVANARARLNPLLGVGWQLGNVVRAGQRVGPAEAFSRAVELLTAVGIGDPHRVARMLPHELSGGMCQRVVIAMALANNPHLMIADEPTAGLDVTVQRQVLDLMATLVREHGAGLLLMTRDLGIVAHYCRRVAVLEAGQIVEVQAVRNFFADPQHPHSRFLLRAAFAAVGQPGELEIRKPR